MRLSAKTQLWQIASTIHIMATAEASASTDQCSLLTSAALDATVASQQLYRQQIMRLGMERQRSRSPGHCFQCEIRWLYVKRCSRLGESHSRIWHKINTKPISRMFTEKYGLLDDNPDYMRIRNISAYHLDQTEHNNKAIMSTMKFLDTCTHPQHSVPPRRALDARTPLPTGPTTLYSLDEP